MLKSVPILPFSAHFSVELKNLISARLSEGAENTFISFIFSLPDI
jgi:hypothetical protein